MAKRLEQGIVKDFPEYVELSNLLNLASLTWPKFGLSAVHLSQIDDITREMIQLWLKSG